MQEQSLGVNYMASKLNKSKGGRGKNKAGAMKKRKMSKKKKGY